MSVADDVIQSVIPIAFGSVKTGWLIIIAQILSSPLFRQLLSWRTSLSGTSRVLCFSVQKFAKCLAVIAIIRPKHSRQLVLRSVLQNSTVLK